MRKVLLAAAILATCTWSTLAAPPTTKTLTAKTIEAENIVLKDSNGKVKITLGISEDKPEIMLMDSKGNKRIKLGVNKDDEPFIITYIAPDPEVDYDGWNTVIGNSSWILSSEDYFNLSIMSIHNVGGYALTDKLNKEGIISTITYNDSKPKVILTVNTDTQPDWNYHIGKGRFSVSDREVRVAYTEAAEYVKENIYDSYSYILTGVEDDDLYINFEIQGYAVGTWNKGVFKLKGE